jgi:hypothetical protein
VVVGKSRSGASIRVAGVSLCFCLLCLVLLVVLVVLLASADANDEFNSELA